MTHSNTFNYKAQKKATQLLSYDTYTTNTKPIKIGLVFVKAPSGGNSIQKHLPEILGRCLLHHQNLQR